MNSPAAALTWELWTRHRSRLLAIVGLVLFFAFVYPWIYARAGLSLNSPDALDDLAAKFAGGGGGLAEMAPGARALHVLLVFMLMWSPMGAMVVTLAYVVWMFTFTEFDPKAKAALVFPRRIFTFPVSSRFLSLWLMGLGVATIVLLDMAWVHLVKLPRVAVFAGYENCLPWIALLILAQAIVWALDGWPVCRAILLSGFLFFVMALPNQTFIPEEKQPPVLLSLIIAGAVVAQIGLAKVRKGKWQSWTWKWRAFVPATAGKMRGPTVFRSPAQAQFWLEWRRFSKSIVVLVAVLCWVPLVIAALAVSAQSAPIDTETTYGFCLYPLLVAPFLHFCFGIGHEPAMPLIQSIRPLTNGEILVAKLKAAAVSSLLSWGVVLLTLGAAPFLGDVPAMLRTLPDYEYLRALLPPLLPVIFVGLIVLTWRCVAVNICLRASRFISLTFFLTYGFFVAVAILFSATHEPKYQAWFLEYLPPVLGALVLLKFALAGWAFEIALERRLLARSALIRYLIVWVTLAVILLAPGLLVLRREIWPFSFACSVILLLPLARIAYAPMALNRARRS